MTKYWETRTFVIPVMGIEPSELDDVYGRMHVIGSNTMEGGMRRCKYNWLRVVCVV